MTKEKRVLHYTVSNPSGNLWLVVWSASSPHLFKSFESCKLALNWAMEEANLWWTRMKLKADVLVKDPQAKTDFLFEKKAGKWQGRPLKRESEDSGSPLSLVLP